MQTGCPYTVIRDRAPKLDEFIFILDPKGRISFLGARSPSICPGWNLVGSHYSCLFCFMEQPDIFQVFLENRKRPEFGEPFRAKLFAGGKGAAKSAFGTVEIRSKGMYGKIDRGGESRRFRGVWGTAKLIFDERKSSATPFEANQGLAREIVHVPDANSKDPVEKERRRIAMELHDGVGQILTALKMDVERACMKLEDRDYELSGILHAASRKSRNAIREIKAISEFLAPDPLARLGLCGAIDELCRDSAESSGFSVQFFSDMACERLSPSTRLTVYRVAQEALSNALSHSKARTIRVSLSQRRQAVSLTIQDDGKGFDVLAATARNDDASFHGLAIMRQRAQSLGGTFCVRSDGLGTVVMVELPFKTPSGVRPTG